MFQLQQEEEQKIRDRAANEAALAAIGSGSKRKRLSAAGISEGGAGVSGATAFVVLCTHVGCFSCMSPQADKFGALILTSRPAELCDHFCT